MAQVGGVGRRAGRRGRGAGRRGVPRVALAGCAVVAGVLASSGASGRRRCRARGRLLRPAALRGARGGDDDDPEPLRPVLYDEARDVVRLLDQRRLPAEELWLELADRRRGRAGDQGPHRARRARDRRRRRVRRSPVEARRGAEPPRLRERGGAARRARGPTAVNLAWAVRRMSRRLRARRRGAPRRGARHPRRGRGGLPAHRRARRAAPPAARARPHPLQRGRARDRGLRHRARRRARRGRGGQRRSPSSPTRRARSCRARGSPPGSCSATASR